MFHLAETDDAGMKQHEAWSDVIIVQGMSFWIFPSITRTEKIVIADLYDPFQLEQLEMNKYSEPARWEDEVTKAVSLLNEQAGACGHVPVRIRGAEEPVARRIVGSRPPESRQLRRGSDFRVAGTYRSVRPAWRSSHPAAARHQGRRSRDLARRSRARSGRGDLQLVRPRHIEAMGLLADERPEIKLFFLSARHFNPDVPEMKALRTPLPRRSAWD
ncbi:hypothetical protein [Microbacterium aurum]